MKTIRDMPVEIIPVIISPLAIVDEQSLNALGQLFIGEEKDENRIGRRLSEAAIARSLEIWRRCAQKVMHGEDPQVREVCRQEAVMAGDERVSEE
jgi:hypothetical protein